MPSNITPKAPINIGHPLEDVISQALNADIYTIDLDDEQGELPPFSYVAATSQSMLCFLTSSHSLYRVLFLGI